MSEMKEAYQAYLISPCAVGDELPIAFEAGYLAGQASVEERVKELEQERDEAVRQWERFERMAGDNWAALKAQAGEPVAWQHRQRGLKEYEWQEWQTVGYKPQGPESQTFQMRPLFTHPTTERRVEEQALQIAIIALNRLANLGNGDVRGNSIGNDIAAEAIDRIDALNAAPAPTKGDSYAD